MLPEIPLEDILTPDQALSLLTLACSQLREEEMALPPRDKKGKGDYWIKQQVLEKSTRIILLEELCFKLGSSDEEITLALVSSLAPNQK